MGGCVGRYLDDSQNRGSSRNGGRGGETEHSSVYKTHYSSALTFPLKHLFLKFCLHCYLVLFFHSDVVCKLVILSSCNLSFDFKQPPVMSVMQIFAYSSCLSPLASDGTFLQSMKLLPFYHSWKLWLLACFWHLDHYNLSVELPLMLLCFIWISCNTPTPCSRYLWRGVKEMIVQPQWVSVK